VEMSRLVFRLKPPQKSPVPTNRLRRRVAVCGRVFRVCCSCLWATPRVRGARGHCHPPCVAGRACCHTHPRAGVCTTWCSPGPLRCASWRSSSPTAASWPRPFTASPPT
jgi:hypothetical protein